MIADVPAVEWRVDLTTSLSAVLFAREQVEAQHLPDTQLSTHLQLLLTELCNDVHTTWFTHAPVPVMIGMSSLPALQMFADDTEHRFYVMGITDTWPQKHVSSITDHVLTVDARASRRFVDGLITGDLGGSVIQLTEPELELIGNHSIGWVTRYEHRDRDRHNPHITIIEIDPWATGSLDVDNRTRLHAYSLVNVPEHRLDMYTTQNSVMFDDISFRQNFILSRLLLHEQAVKRIIETETTVDVIEFIHVNGSRMVRTGLGAVNEVVFLKALGSITAKNKVRSALSIGAKDRLCQLFTHGSALRDVAMINMHTTEFQAANQQHSIRSHLVSGGRDGLFIRTKYPWDSFFIFAMSLLVCEMLALWALRTQGDILSQVVIALVVAVAFGLTFHRVRYNDWSLGDSVRRRRLCRTDDDLQLHMSRLDAIRTMSEAGANGAPMDGLSTIPFSTSTTGKFAVINPLDVGIAEQVGLKLRVDTNLNPVWVDLRGTRAAVRVDRRGRGMWRPQGPYIDENYIDLTVDGPTAVGGALDLMQ